MRKNKFRYFFVLLIVILSFFKGALAIESDGAGGATGGTASFTGTCKNPWCHEMVGIRISLYSFDGTNLTFYKSKDYEIKTKGVEGRDEYAKDKYKDVDLYMTSSTNRRGKLDYINNSSLSKAFIKVSSLKNIKNYINSGDTIKGSYSTYFAGSDAKDFSSSLKYGVLKYFGISKINGKYKATANDVKNKINTIFGTTFSTTALENLYITVEPTLLIYNIIEGDVRGKDAQKRVYYYGSAYELANLRVSKGTMMGLETVLGGNLYNSIYISSKEGLSDKNNLLKNKIGKNAIVSAFPKAIFASTGSCSKTGCPGVVKNDAGKTINVKNVSTKMLEKNGFGINVFWFGNYVDTVETCSSTCSGKSGNVLLNCAENFCERTSASSSAKKTCITSCGYSEPSGLSCSGSTCSDETSSSCSISTGVRKKTTCNYSNFVRTNCTLETSLDYSTELPTIFSPGIGGFNYTIHTSGKRYCTLTFDVNKFNFEYASRKRNDRSGLINILNNFKNISSASYPYNNTFNTLNMNIDGEIYSFVEKSSSISNQSVTSKNSKTIRYFGANDTTEVINSEKNTNSIGNAVYELPRQCLNTKSGIVSSLLPAGCSDLKTHSDYYAYYNLKRQNGRVNVVINAEKEDSCLDDANTCYYMIEDDTNDTDCYLEKSELGDNYIIKFNITNIGANILSYVFNGISYDLDDYDVNELPSVTIKKSEFKSIEGNISFETKEGKKITRACNLNDDGDNKQTCKELYKPTQYDEIRNYCNKNYLTDGFSDSNSCYNYCSASNKSCKYNIDCTNVAKVKNWCSNASNRTRAGYTSYNQCVNDCSCNGGNGAEYIYRPIALGNSSKTDYPYNAFPNREAGSNWYGYESLTIENSFEKKPIYVIELDRESIKKIKQNTLSSGKYIYKDLSSYYKVSIPLVKSDTYLNLKSNFIKDNPEIFTCVNGVGEGC